MTKQISKLGLFVALLVNGILLGQVPSNYPLSASAPATSTKVTAQTVGSANYATFYYWVIVNYPIGSSVPFGPAIVTNAPSPLTALNFVRISWDAVVGATNYSVVVSTTNLFPASGATALVGTTASTTINHNNTPLTTYTSTGNIGTASGNIVLNNRDLSVPRITTTPGINPSALGMPSGASLPATCIVGDAFFLTTATAGQNLYGCTGINVWTLQSGAGGVTSITAGASGALLVTPTVGNAVVDVDTAYVPGKLSANIFTQTNTFQGLVAFTPATNTAITAPTNTINCARAAVQVTPNANIILSSAPTIAAGVDGQVCEISNLSATNTLVLADATMVSGTNISAKDRIAVVIPPLNSVSLRYSTSSTTWMEVTTSAFNQFVSIQEDEFCLPTPGWIIGSFGGAGQSGGVCTIGIEHNAVFGSGTLFQQPYLTGAAFIVAAKSRLKIQQAANTGFRWGIFDGNGYVSPTNGIYIEKLPADVSMFAVCNSGGVSTRTALGTADANFHIFGISVISPTTAIFSLDGSSFATITTNCPASLSGYRQGFQFGVSDAVTRIMTIDWMRTVIPRP